MNNVDHLNLGKPIGGATQPHPTTGEHGVGTGVSGGHSSANAHNSQAGGAFVGGSSAFNAGLGGDHASAGLPKDGSHPIADKFMGQSGGQDTVSGSYEGGSTRDALAGQSHGHTTGHGAASGLGAGAGAGLAGAGAGAAIAGQYAGSGTNDALTGQSDARITGEGVGPLGENTGDNARAAGLSSTAGGAAGAAGAAGVIGTGVGPQGGAGGHYTSDSNQTGSRHEQPATTSNLVKEGEATGHFGHADNDDSRGLPISDPKSLDSGGPHGLVYQESTGKYVHRHELEGKK